MDKNENIVFVIGVLIGAGLTMLVTNIQGYRKAVKAMKDEDYDAKETVSEDSKHDGDYCETEIVEYGEW